MDKEKITQGNTKGEEREKWFLRPLLWKRDVIDEHPVLMRRLNVGCGLLGALITMLEGRGWFAVLGWIFVAALMWLTFEQNRLLNEWDGRLMDFQKRLDESQGQIDGLRAENKHLKETRLDNGQETGGRKEKEDERPGR